MKAAISEVVVFEFLNKQRHRMRFELRMKLINQSVK